MSYITGQRSKLVKKNLIYCNQACVTVLIKYGICDYPLNDKSCKGCKYRGELVE